jgi:CheY-like chemotaxis protein
MPDLLLIDVNMPGLNGDTVVRMLGSAQVNSQMIVLLHSSLQDEVLAQKVKVSRAHGYIRKSDNPQVLIREVSRWIRPSANSGPHSLDALIANRASSGTMLASPRSPELPELAREDSQGSAARKLLLVDHDMLALSEYRHLTKSLGGSVEFALSGRQALQRIQGDSPPDVVVLGKLVESPGIDEVLQAIAQLGSRWGSRCIVLYEDTVQNWPRSFEITRLRGPITETELCRAIQGCLKRAS